METYGAGLRLAGTLGRLDETIECLEAEFEERDPTRKLIIYETIEKACREVAYNDGLRRAIDRRGALREQLVRQRASLTRKEEELRAALASREEDPELCEQLQITLNSLVLCLHALGERRDLIGRLKETEELAERRTDMDGLVVSLINQAEILAIDLGQPDKGLEKAEKAERIAVEHALSRRLKKDVRPVLQLIASRLKGKRSQ
jgi:hypothetical protein